MKILPTDPLKAMILVKDSIVGQNLRSVHQKSQ